MTGITELRELKLEDLVEKFKSTKYPKSGCFNELLHRVWDYNLDFQNSQDEELKKTKLRDLEYIASVMEEVFPIQEGGNNTGIYKVEGTLLKDFEQDDIIYIAGFDYIEHDVDSILFHTLKSIPEFVYVQKDFYDIAKENINDAEYLFESCDYAHPEARIDEIWELRAYALEFDVNKIAVEFMNFYNNDYKKFADICDSDFTEVASTLKEVKEKMKPEFRTSEANDTFIIGLEGVYFLVNESENACAEVYLCEIASKNKGK